MTIYDEKLKEILSNYEKQLDLYKFERSSPKLCVNCSACIMLPSPGRQPAACVPAADAKEGHPCRAVKGCPAFGQRAVP